MDDLILLSKSSEQMQQLKEDLSHRFKMKDLGKLHYCLGISVTLDESSQTIRLNQSRYLVKILEKYGLTEANSVSTPADPNVKLLKDDGCSKKVDSLRYQSAYCMQQEQLVPTLLKLLEWYPGLTLNLQKLI